MRNIRRSGAGVRSRLATGPALSNGSQSAPRRILVVKLADIGDVLLLTPALRALRERYPRARIDVLTTRNGQQALSRSRFHDEILLFDKQRFDRPGQSASLGALRAGVALFFRLRRGKYDTIVLPNHLPTAWGALKFALLALASGAPCRVGLDNGRGWFLNHAVADRGFGALHEREYWLRVVAQLDAAGSNDRPVFDLTAVDRARATEILLRAGAKPGQVVVAIHPTTGRYASSRQWPPDRFAAVADYLAAHHGATIVLLGGPDAVDATAEVARRMSGPAITLAGQTSLPVSAAILATSALVIANDSALAHLAGVLGRPLLALFGPSNEAAWSPYGAEPLVLPLEDSSTPDFRARAVTVRCSDPHAPCLYVGFSAGNPDGCPACHCMTGIDVARINRIASRLLTSTR